jgi:hypothetical protein
VQPVAVAPLATQDTKNASPPAIPGVATGTGFTYQGRLLDNGLPANGQYDFAFTLWATATNGGTPVAPTVLAGNQSVVSGLFTVVLDFGSSAFTGDARWLQIAVRATGGASYVALVPRQPLTATPFSLSSRWEGTVNKPFPYNPMPQANSVVTLTNSAGPNAITVGTDGLGLISYFAGGLMVGHCADSACSSATTARIDNASTAGSANAITIGADGLGLISYMDTTNSAVKVMHGTNVPCNLATPGFGAAAPGANQTSITVGTDGLGLLAFSGSTLKVAHCVNTACNPATVSVVDSNTLGAAVITTGADGLGLLAYDDINHHLKVAHCANAACTSATASLLDPATSLSDFSITLAADGLGLISYRTAGVGPLKVAHCANVLCNSASLSIIDSAPLVGAFNSITLGADGLGLISYSDTANHSLKVAHCANVACSAATIVTVAALGIGTYITSATIGTDGLPLISYGDTSSPTSKVVHCASPLCVSYQRTRR